MPLGFRWDHARNSHADRRSSHGRYLDHGQRRHRRLRTAPNCPVRSWTLRISTGSRSPGTHNRWRLDNWFSSEIPRRSSAIDSHSCIRTPESSALSSTERDRVDADADVGDAAQFFDAAALALMGRSGNLTVLDFGCGDGALVADLRANGCEEEERLGSRVDCR